MEFVYVLEHSYELTDDYGEHEERKLIGVYKTNEDAESAINRLKVMEGFRDHPVDCFLINKMKLNQDHYDTGFFTVYFK